jgi:MFS family permease
MLGPIVSGFVSPALGWRWSFWVALIFAGVSCTLIVLLSETNLNQLKILHQDFEEATTLRLTMTKSKSKRNWSETITRILLRPLYLLLTEPIVSTCSGYLALCYSIYYMSFQAFPIIFVQLYGLSPGQCGLVQLTIAAGCILTLPIYWAYNEIWLHHRQIENQLSTKQQKPNAAEYYRLPLACLGGPFFVISLFWLGWSARKDVSFAVPMLAGIPFGMGFMCTFISLLYFCLPPLSA